MPEHPLHVAADALVDSAHDVLLATRQKNLAQVHVVAADDLADRLKSLYQDACTDYTAEGLLDWALKQQHADPVRFATSTAIRIMPAIESVFPSFEPSTREDFRREVIKKLRHCAAKLTGIEHKHQ